MSSLNSGTVGTLRGTLELECDRSNANLAHPLLSKEAQLGSIQYHRGSVETFRFDLNGRLEEHMERIAGTIREELGTVLRQNPPEPFQFNLDIVVRRPR